MQFGVVSLFPELFEQALGVGVLGRAVRAGRIACRVLNPRDYTADVHRTVDDRPFGGGPGMVMKPEPLAAAIGDARKALPEARVALLSPQGRVFHQGRARAWADAGSLILVAGRYEGIDERIVEHHIDEEISLGDFVLSGGEFAALTIIDAVARLVPGVLGHPDSALEESFSDGLLEGPQYTRPECFEGHAAPEVLLSGDHARIAAWRREQALKRTRLRRPDLLEQARLSETDKQFLANLGGADGDHRN